MSVPETQQYAAITRVDADDPVREAARICDAVDDRGGPHDADDG